MENEVKELKFQIEGYEDHFRELGKTLEKSSDYYIKTIKELQEENRKLWSSSAHNNRNAGRKKNNEEIRKRYLTFCSLMKEKTSMKDIMEIMQISRSTYYRFLKEYKIKSEDPYARANVELFFYSHYTVPLDALDVRSARKAAKRFAAGC